MVHKTCHKNPQIHIFEKCTFDHIQQSSILCITHKRDSSAYRTLRVAHNFLAFAAQVLIVRAVVSLVVLPMGMLTLHIAIRRHVAATALLQRHARHVAKGAASRRAAPDTGNDTVEIVGDVHDLHAGGGRHSCVCSVVNHPRNNPRVHALLAPGFAHLDTGNNDTRDARVVDATEGRALLVLHSVKDLLRDEEGEWVAAGLERVYALELDKPDAAHPRWRRGHQLLALAGENVQDHVQ
jgi:hypothetical protein